MIELLLWLAFYVAYTEARQSRARPPAPVAIVAPVLHHVTSSVETP